MNFYPFNIGDYAGKTRHLSWDEDMAYRRLLDVYYSTEAPLPADKKRIYRLAGAQTARQKEAVDTVLIEFFDLRGDGFRNARCDEEVAKANIKKEKAKQSAAVRWSGTAHSEGNANASADDMRTHSEGNANASADDMRTHSEGNAPNPNPNPNPKSRGEVLARARDPDADLEAKLRAAAGWQSHPNPRLAVTGEIQALIDNGADLDLDVLPIIKALAPQVHTPSWKYFVKAIAHQRDQRIAASTVVSLPTSSQRSMTHAANRQKPSRAETFDAIRRRIDQIADAEANGEPAGDGHGSPRDIAEGKA